MAPNHLNDFVFAPSTTTTTTTTINQIPHYALVALPMALGVFQTALRVLPMALGVDWPQKWPNTAQTESNIA
jgi:hypothetical protein